MPRPFALDVAQTRRPSLAPKLALQIAVRWEDVLLDVVSLEAERRLRVDRLPCAHVLSPAALAELARSGTRRQLGEQVRVTSDRVSFDLRVVEAARIEAEAPAPFDARTPWSLLLSAALHLMALAWVAFMMPPLGADDDAFAERGRMLSMLAYLDAAALRERSPQVAPVRLADDPDADHGDLPYPGGTGTRSRGEEGTMGSPALPIRSARFAVQRHEDREPSLARETALREMAAQVGLVATVLGAIDKAPRASWGGVTASGDDENDPRGAMWGDAPGEATGTGGLGLAGTGEGGGGSGEAVGLGHFGALGHGIGTGSGTAVGAGHKVGVPSIRTGETSVSGRLPPQAIQRIVRQSFGRFRLCYEGGLRTKPSLEGVVTVRFLIDRSGAVGAAADAGSTLADREVVSCIVRAFAGLTFPAPEGGNVTVVYPLALAPEA
jgi:hypothetical protein